MHYCNYNTGLLTCGAIMPNIIYDYIGRYTKLIKGILGKVC